MHSVVVINWLRWSFAKDWYIFPSSVQVIDVNAFRHCEQLEEVELCEGLEKIEGSAFEDCKSLNRFRIPSTVEEIRPVAAGVELCEGLQKIGKRAFSSCFSLRNAAFPPKAEATLSFEPGCYDLMKLRFSMH